MDLLKTLTRVASGKNGGAVLSLDCGTTSTRAILFSKGGAKLAHTFREHEPTLTHDGSHVEYAAELLLRLAVECIDECVAKAPDVEIAGLAITNQRETMIVWDKDTGVPYHNAIVWHDTRTAGFCGQLRKVNDGELAAAVKQKAGLLISPYFSASKVRWLQDNNADVAEGLERGSAMFGTLDTWLIWNLTEREVYATDTTNASRTALMDLEALKWSDELKDVFGISKKLLFPSIRACNADFGTLTTTALKGNPILSVIGDQHAALVGNNCMRPGECKTTYGTGAFMVINTGPRPVHSERLLTTIGYHLDGQDPIYALEGAVGSCGTAIEWLVTMGLLPGRADKPSKPDVDQIEPIALVDGGSASVVVVPALSGLYAPYWVNDAKAATFNQTVATRRGNLVHATLEGIAFQVGDVLKVAAEDMGVPIREHRVDGGVSNSKLLMQIQADLTGSPVYRAENKETTALGAALLGMLRAGMYTRVEEFKNTYKLDGKPFKPRGGIADEVAEKWRKWDICIKLTTLEAEMNRDDEN